MATYAITGIQKCLGPGEQVPIRRELDEWWFAKDKNTLYQKSLFVYALNEFKSMNPNERDSYFQIAGIHGQPLQSWDTNDPEKDWYCVHGSVLFSPWHRPYLALYEQRIYEIMVKLIPKTFATQDHAGLYKAADSWRLPFWDCAVKRPDWTDPQNQAKFGPNVPYLLTVDTVEVLTKIGTAKVENPMWRFKVPQMNPGKTTFGDYGVTAVEEPEGTLHYNLSKSTSRYPETPDPNDPKFQTAWVEGQQNWQNITGMLRASKASQSNTLPEAIYRLFIEKYVPTWNVFATGVYKVGQNPQQYSSVEDIHNNVHGHVGGTGHMGNVGVASFDPIFWLHHCNVDRLFAIWQELYPNKYVEAWDDPNRGKVDVNTKLTPFNKTTTGVKWTPADIRDPKKMGYTYPELQKWLPAYKDNAGCFSRTKYENAIRTTLEQKYSTTGKSVTLLPGMEETAKKLMSACSQESAKYENFPPALLKLRETLLGQAVSVASDTVQAGVNILSDVSGGLLGGMMGWKPKPGGNQSSSGAPGGSAHAPFVDFSWESQDYICNILYDRWALGGHPFTIRVFLGEVTIPKATDPNGKQRLSASQLCNSSNPGQVGIIYNFSSPVESRGTGVEGCTTCRKQKEATGSNRVLTTGQVVLTDHLVEWIRNKQKGKGGVCLDDFTQASVGKWLKDNLHWRVTDQHGKLVDKAKMKDLKVSIAVGKAKHCLDATVPSIYSDYEVLYGVTDGRMCGACPGDLN
ncbi:Di-copper centre-containing [Glarea lozoyensis ATCC 20868]|uniref:tyrosinase n=1 Tax=Glarea lozoyensis (strain ATCC 20868 / MF5171) TaxID=1116229 RepID=S3CQU7_GLAL2|nr:Di-copper centre-containing [Glarea lozoyensis ATCC 20868]EPE28797.1 Di-copper centre-containing [Glarea lozoyensis ATCC 20868]